MDLRHLRRGGLATVLATAASVGGGRGQEAREGESDCDRAAEEGARVVASPVLGHGHQAVDIVIAEALRHLVEPLSHLSRLTREYGLFLLAQRVGRGQKGLRDPGKLSACHIAIGLGDLFRFAADVLRDILSMAPNGLGGMPCFVPSRFGDLRRALLKVFGRRLGLLFRPAYWGDGLRWS